MSGADYRRRMSELATLICFQLQLLRLRFERILNAFRGSHRVLAVASWAFPVDSQAFVYEELTRLIKRGFAVRLFYGSLNQQDPQPSRFRALYRAGRRLVVDPVVCRASYAYFKATRPERVSCVIDTLSRESGLDPETLLEHRHVQHAFAFARMAEVYRPHYLHSYFFYEGSLFALVASMLLDIPRGVTCCADHVHDDYELKMVSLHLRQSSVIVAGSARVRDELIAIECRTSPAQILTKSSGIDIGQAFSDRLKTLLAWRQPWKRAPRPLVSVVIIFLNGEKYIRDAIESVLLQSYGNWELLLVDDGSSDGSTDIAKHYAAQQPGRIRYLEHEGHRNRGMSASRNVGVSHASGAYVALLDADDMWLPFKLERQVAIMESHPEAAMLFGATEYWWGWTAKPEDRARDHIPSAGIETDLVYDPPALSTALYPLGTATAPCPSDLLIRRDRYLGLGGFAEEFKGMYEDQAFLAKVYASESVYISSECWDRYRIHRDSCVAVTTAAGQYESYRRFFLTWFQNYVRQKALKRPELAAAIEAALQEHRPPPHEELTAEPLDFGTLRRLTPLSANWGLDRGLPVDRYYIEQFLATHADDIRGHVLEIGDAVYTRRFGGERVTASDVLPTEGSPETSLAGDLAAGDLPSNSFDCMILPQALQCIYDTRAALRTIHRVLKPVGVLLATFPGITKDSHQEPEGPWFWAFTTRSSGRLFGETFGDDRVSVAAHGNVLAATSFLHGVAAEELQKNELDHRDPDYEMLITVRAVKAEGCA